MHYSRTVDLEVCLERDIRFTIYTPPLMRISFFAYFVFTSIRSLLSVRLLSQNDSNDSQYIHSMGGRGELAYLENKNRCKGPKPLILKNWKELQTAHHWISTRNSQSASFLLNLLGLYVGGLAIPTYIRLDFVNDQIRLYFASSSRNGVIVPGRLE